MLRLCVLLVCALLTAAPSAANEVTIENQGLDVLGNLELAPGKTLKSDGVVLLVHDTLSHHRMEIMSAMQELLRERGINSLAITLGLGLNARRGLFDCSIEQDHRNEDAAVEIAGWINWLKEQGASSVTVAGHARGGTQAAIYAAKDPDKVVKRLILIAPLADTPTSLEAEYDQRFKQPLPPILAQAEKLVAEDQFTTLMLDVPFLVCDRAKVTAGAFVNYYGSNQNLYTPSLLPHIKLPTLVVVGDQDPLASELVPAIQGIPGPTTFTLVEIPGADHFFRDQAAEDLTDRIKAFLEKK
ncbi:MULTISPECIES: alpha/beta hydrolase [Rhodomicrobium]|uniref:alpha/beta hydrolase n=1 Tax=Rhodomicrobium TaxID=1068 RepID=UPI00148224D1|nr:MULTISPECIES: alpha/beta hydrolase [Rhodomicrobium]